MIKPMLLNLHRNPPIGEDWVYEVKYDGFRCVASLDKDTISLQSRNGKTLNHQFPEVVNFMGSLLEKEDIKQKLPLIFDGEIAILSSPMKADFAAIQKRGRTKKTEKVEALSQSNPATYLVFDILQVGNETLYDTPLFERKEILKELFSTLQLPLSPSKDIPFPLQYVPFHKKADTLWDEIKLENGEGMIAKKIRSTYRQGKRSDDWIKIKNYKVITCFITSFQKENGFFHVGLYKNSSIVPIGLFSHGMNQDERQALLSVIKANSYKEDSQFIHVEPGICLDLFYLELYQSQLRHPEFHRFRFDVQVKDCTFDKLQKSDINLPKSVGITNPEKPLWKDESVTKLDFLHYLKEVAPYILPFLKNRLLTTIRFPHGMFGESFYQKNCPDYAPSFVETTLEDGIRYIVCNNLETLLWLGNQLAIEFHIPFQKIGDRLPCEIVFDLDPPSAEYFYGAIKGALMMQKIFEQLGLQTFVKTSGRKGLQVYLPIPEKTFSYEDTRIFTEFIANYLVSKEPELFTIERLKKKRGNKIYVDYIQHGEGKTIISPYSLRGNTLPTVAAPLFWPEVNTKLKPEFFTIFSVMERLKEKGDPFKDYLKIQANQPFGQVLTFLKKV
nr:DNA ligase D [Bacillus tianshenii]